MIETSGNNEIRRKLIGVVLENGFEPWLNNANWNAVAEIMELTPGIVRGQYRRLLSWLMDNGMTIEDYIDDVGNEMATYKSTKINIEEKEATTFEQLIKATGINSDIFEVEKGSIWGSIYNMSASFRFKRRTLPTKKQADVLIESLKKYVPKQIPLARKNADGKHVAVISLYDIQLGRLGKFGNKGTEYNIEKYFEVLDQLMQPISSYNLDEIVFVLGNDFADTDNMFNTTTKGTPQPQDLHWKHSIDKQCDVARETIDRLRSIASVRVILVGGNHDMYSNFWLGKYVEAVYEHAEDVSIDNEEKYRKFYRYGNTSIMFTHGNEEKATALPAIFMKEGGTYYAEAPYNEVHMGHYHQRSDKWQVLTEEYGVYIRVLPSLSPSSDWEDLKAFILHNRAGIAHVYHTDKGQVAEFYGKI